MDLYNPPIPSHASREYLQEQVNILDTLKNSLDPMFPTYQRDLHHYQSLINDLTVRLQSSPGVLKLPVMSHKRSLGSTDDYPQSKRPSPAPTPRAKPSKSAQLAPGLMPGPRAGEPFRAYSALDYPRYPMGYQPSNYIDLTGEDESLPSPFQDPFPELDTAYNWNAFLPDGAGIAFSNPTDLDNSEYMTLDQVTRWMEETNNESGRIRQGAMNGYFPVPAPSLHVPTLLRQQYTPLPRVHTEDAGEAVQKLIENIKAHDNLPREQTPKEMGPTQLKEHQKIGLAWLIKMEESTKGGILADEMGLGKTVQALALILARPSKDKSCKTTLIIAPVALMRQWEKEIERHVQVQHRLSVYVYHNSGKNADFEKLRDYDVVLTTYGTLASEFKQKENRIESRLALQEQQDPMFIRNRKDELALLGRKCMWYRVILDEAQCIKNRSTQVSKASNDLQAKYRLCMTGTPMMNSIDELYPLVRFLKVEGFQDWRKFSAEISRPIRNNRDWTRDRGLRRVQALLKSVMLRRQKDSEVDGEPVCRIPAKHTRSENVTFSDPERELYQAIETHSQLKFNKYLQKGTVNNNYANVLTLLLRLRQACCHPHLINDLGVQVSTEGIEEDELLSRAQQLKEDVVARIKEADGAFECPICLEAEPNPTIVIPCGHTLCGECFQKIVENALSDDGSGAKCPHCRGALSTSMITDFRHFLKVFSPEAIQSSDEELGSQAGDDSVNDSQSETDEEGDLDGFVVPDDADDSFEAPQGDSSGEKRVKGKDKGKARALPKVTLAQLKKESMRSKSAKKKYIRRLRKTFTDSTKIDRTVELLSQIQADDPTEKTLIFSQFTSLLDLLEVPLLNKRFKYLRYDGSMRMNDRVDTIDRFMDDSTENILLVSLKAGNAGLNLSKASRVIMMDPFWNPYIEEQAVDRAHRMPQTREVVVHRMLVPETVEDRICALQEKKREFITAALDERAGKSLTRLNVQELQYLFGLRDHA